MIDDLRDVVSSAPADLAELGFSEAILEHLRIFQEHLNEQAWQRFYESILLEPSAPEVNLAPALQLIDLPLQIPANLAAVPEANHQPLHLNQNGRLQLQFNQLNDRAEFGFETEEEDDEGYETDHDSDSVYMNEVE